MKKFNSLFILGLMTLLLSLILVGCGKLDPAKLSGSRWSDGNGILIFKSDGNIEIVNGDEISDITGQWTYDEANEEIALNYTIEGESSEWKAKLINRYGQLFQMKLYWKDDEGMWNESRIMKYVDNVETEG